LAQGLTKRMSTDAPNAKDAPTPETGGPHKLRDVWQVPAFVGAGAVLVGAAVYAFMTAPKPDIAGEFKKAEELMQGQAYGEALELLGQRVLPVLNKGGLTKEQERGLYLMRARALYLGQKEAGVSREENHKNILKEYDRALKLDAQLQPQDEAYRAKTYLALGKLDEAGLLAVDLPAELRSDRIALLKGIIDASLGTPRGRAAMALHGDHATHAATGGAHADPHAAASGHDAGEHASNQASSHESGHGSSHGPAVEAKSDGQRAFDLLDTLAREVDLTDDERLWTLTRQSRWLLAQGQPDEAVTKILRTLPRIDINTDRTVRAEVLITLARAYMAEGELDGASMPLSNALDAVGETDPLAAEIFALRGQVYQQLEQLEEAKIAYEAVITGFEHSPWRAISRLGLAEVESQLAQRDEGSPEVALDHYTVLVDALDARARGGKAFDEGQESAIDQTELVSSLLDRAIEQFERDQLRQSLRFATLAERAAQLKVEAKGHDAHASASGQENDAFPSDLTLVLAETRRQLADELLGVKEGSDTGQVLTLASLDATTQREARQLLMIAGKRYMDHADEMVQTDPASYADALWNAADSFDRAGDLQESIRAFERFVADMPSDPRQPEAVFRMGLAYRAQGEMKLAEKAFRSLIVDSDGSGRSGPFADASYVPLAQVLLTDDNAENDKDATNLLQEVLSGRLGGTSTRRYREALLESGELAMREGKYERAIEHLSEYVERAEKQPVASLANNQAGAAFESTPLPELPLVVYKLAEACRMAAREMDTVLAGALPDTDAREIRTLRGQRLSRAAGLYETVISGLEAMTNRSPLHDVALRNSYFYRGDCAFDQRDFDVAIRHYEAARERYSKDPASLVALTQIVSAYMAQSEWDRARVANARAKKFYESLPEQVWNDPSLPMSRREWERWLDAQGKLASTKLGENESTQAASQEGEDE
jgi:tetratricopeptide (TPR) repeat protein